MYIADTMVFVPSPFFLTTIDSMWFGSTSYRSDRYDPRTKCS